MLVELGGGTAPHPRADVVIDLHHPKNSPAQDASLTPWVASAPAAVPFLADSVDEVYCAHFMEHVHHGQPLINVMNEAWRVLKPGGTFTMVLPLIGYTDPVGGHPQSNHIGWQPWADPTHVSYWWFPEALLYFCEGAFRPNADYGMACWAALGEFVNEAYATRFLEQQRQGPAAPPLSWWSVRGGWEGVARLMKPTEE